jgi:hypothetical protein
LDVQTVVRRFAIPRFAENADEIGKVLAHMPIKQAIAHSRSSNANVESKRAVLNGAIKKRCAWLTCNFSKDEKRS